METCPLTGEPLPDPGQTISHTALQQLRAATNNLAGLRFDYQQALTAHRPTEVHVRMPARSNPPLNLHLVDQCSDHWDTLLVWAAEIMAHVNPLVRVPNNNWAAIETVYQAHTLKLATWTYAPTMHDEVTDAITQLTRATYPAGNTPTNTPTVKNPEEALNLELPRKQALAAASHILQHRFPPGTLDGWEHQGIIQPTQHNPKTYRVGDLVDAHKTRI